MVAHFFITLRLPFPPDCILNITENYPKVGWNCSKLFIKVCLCLNNKPISGVTEEAGFFPLFPVLLCDWGYWDYSASQYTRLPWDLNVCLLQSRSFSALLISGTACSTPNSFTLVMSEKCHYNIFWNGGEKWQNAECCFSLFIYSFIFHLHIKQGEKKKQSKRNSVQERL